MENAASVPTALGGGHHGHLELVTNPICYLTISRGVAFNPLRNLRPVPVPACLPVHDDCREGGIAHATQS
eukprot:5853977-Ditylum_brightwellii.AAC.1